MIRPAEEKMRLNATLFSALIASSSLLFFLLLAIAPPTVRSAPSSPKHLFLGIAPGDEDYYRSSDVIRCKEGSKKFTKDQLNDDFCDCPDGTDEPGTSACPHGKFYCQNAGHVPRILFSSMVNDGICDCCDGSDEYNRQVKCANTCWEAGKVARDKLNKKIATYQEGSKVRKQEVEYANKAIAKDEAELLKLKNEEKILKGLVQQLKERKEQIEKAEEKERLQKEKEDKEKKEAEEKANIGKGKAEEEAKQEKGESVECTDGENKPTKSGGDGKSRHGMGSPSDQDAIEDHVDVTADVQPISTPENHESPLNVEEQAKTLPETIEELSREELGRLVASRWTGKDTGKEAEEVDSSKGDYNSPNVIPKDSDDEEYDGNESETDDDSQKHEGVLEDETDRDHREEDLDDSSSSYRYDSDVESDFSDVDISTNPSWLEKVQQTVRNVVQAVNIFQAPVNQSDAAFVRKEYDESTAKLSKIQSWISSLTEKEKHDFGPEKEFYSFYGRCFESKQNKYVYKVCPYKQASQIEGHSSTRLGQWDKFEDSHRFMIFSNGDKCWNGPDRSLKVRLRCGLKNEITDVDEPSRCEYVALLSTPAACLEEKLQELQQKLDLMNREEPQNHDEL